jgi:small subunit ribosomal protein S1
MSTVSKSSEPQLDREALAALYEETFKNLEEGTITEGRVVALTKDKVVVDIGYKSEGMIPSDQFSNDDLQTLKIGDRIQVYIEECEDADGNLILSKEKADKMKIWEELEKLYKEEKSIDGKVVSRIKGGMMVDIGVKAFLPGSQIDLHPVRDLDGLVGRTFPMKIIKINHRRGNVVVSRRVLLEETRDKKRQTTLATLKEGQLIQGMVKNITDYGAFIDLGGIDGLLHITDMSWGRVGHPSEMFNVGDRVEVSVLKYDRETGRISLGLKQKSADPWTNVAGKYPIGTRVKGRVVSLTDYGAFGNVLDARSPSSIPCSRNRRSGRSRGLECGSGQSKDFTGHEADGPEPLGHGRRQIPHRDPHRRESEEPDGFRGLHWPGRGH